MTEDQLDQQFAKFFGQVTARVDKRFAELRGELHQLHEQVDSIRNTVDGIAADLTTEREERAAIAMQQDRQTGCNKTGRPNGLSSSPRPRIPNCNPNCKQAPQPRD
jgi:septal ring factor EnvC (AmiA/AmiB activator)